MVANLDKSDYDKYKDSFHRESDKKWKMFFFF